MISFLLDIFENSPLSETIKIYWNNILSLISSTQVLITENHSVSTFYENLPVSLSFDEFQCKLVKGFSIILLINILLTCLAWKVYGKRVSDRFMKPSTSKAIEELKASVSRLKLPKEHTPRI